MKILITGATGLVGTQLGIKCAELGHEIIVISRNSEKARIQLPFPCRVIEGDLSKAALENKIHVDVVFHLAGESVAGGWWTKSRKKNIYDSRILGTRNLLDSLASAPNNIICASAIGIYGDQSQNILYESESSGTGFLAEVCKDWEKEIFKAEKIFSTLKVCAFRLGIVLASQGGALEKVLFPFRVGVGGPINKGQQMMN